MLNVGSAPPGDILGVKMTFVQLLATEKSAYMACDLRLTNLATGKREPDFAYKLIRVQRPRFSALIGFTGVAFLRGKAVGVWIAEQIEKLDANARVESLLDALAQAESILPRPGSVIDRRLTFAVAAMVGTQSLVSLVSNFEELIDGHISRVLVARDAMTTSGFKSKSELYLATGSGATIKVSGHEQLLLSLRSGVEDLRIFELLRDLNIEVSARASKAGDDSVSPGCYVGSVHATGQGTRRPFLTDEQEGDFIPPEAEQTFKLLESRLGRKIDAFGRPMPIRMVQEAVAFSPGTDKGRREQLKLRPDSAELWNNFGSSLANRRRWNEAIDAYGKALSLDPAYVNALANLAKAFWLYRKDFAEADRLYTKALAVAGASVPSFILSDFAIFCHEALGDLQRAGDLHARAAEDGNNPVAAAQQAWFTFDARHDLERADEQIAHLLDTGPDNAHILCLAGLITLRGYADLKGACEKFHRACSLEPANTLALRMAADTSLQLGDSTSAVYYYQRLIKRVDYDAEIGGSYGLALIMKGRCEAALHHLSKASRSASDNLVIRMYYAAALWAAGKPAEAIELVRTLMDLESPPEVELEANALFLIAEPRSKAKVTARMRQLIASGIKASGMALHAMVSNRPYAGRQEAKRLETIIQGKAAIPGDW